MSITTAPITPGRLERLPLRDVWKHEEHDFTPWLLDNLDVLNDVLDFNITSAKREQFAGSFIVDLVGQDEAGRRVIIENQFHKSNHDHLGKLITYMTNYEAAAGIWIVEDPRPEHVQSIVWLNQSTSASVSFYLIKIEAVRIGDSPPAPLLIRIVGPSIEGKAISVQKDELDARQRTLQRFWAGLLERTQPRTSLHASISPGKDQWIGTSAGMGGVRLNYALTEGESRVELYIDRGHGNANNALFDRLHGLKESIEDTYGGSLIWQRLDGKRACRIVAPIVGGGYKADEDRWPEIQDEMIDSMIRFDHALRSHILKASH